MYTRSNFLLTCFSVGSVFTLLPHSLHNEMAQRPVRTPSVSDVSPGVEVSRVDSDLLSPLSLSYDSELPPLPDSLSRLSLYDVPRTKPEPARRRSPKPPELIGSPKQTRQSPIPTDHSDKRPTDKPPVPPRKPSSVDIKLAHLRNEMVCIMLNINFIGHSIILLLYFLTVFKANLRQMDLQLLSQLRQLNDSINSYRQELMMSMDSYSSSDTDGSDSTSVYSNITPSSFDLSRSSTQSTPKRPPTSTDL